MMKTEEDRLLSSLSKLKYVYYSFWVVVVVSLCIGEFWTSINGLFADNELAKYVAEVLTIVVAGLSIPISLKLVGSQVKKIKPSTIIDEACQIYLYWSRLRVFLLAIAAVVAIATHYLFLSSAGALCAVVVCIAAFLCVPSRKKLNYVLSPIFSQDEEELKNQED